MLFQSSSSSSVGSVRTSMSAVFGFNSKNVQLSLDGISGRAEVTLPVIRCAWFTLRRHLVFFSMSSTHWNQIGGEEEFVGPDAIRKAAKRALLRVSVVS